MNRREILLRAADIVAERWQQRSYGSRGGCRCMAGALAEAAAQQLGIEEDPQGGNLGEILDIVERDQELMGPIRIATRSNDVFVYAWNDDLTRTQAEVVDALRRAAELVQ